MYVIVWTRFLNKIDKTEEDTQIDLKEIILRKVTWLEFHINQIRHYSPW